MLNSRETLSINSYRTQLVSLYANSQKVGTTIPDMGSFMFKNTYALSLFMPAAAETMQVKNYKGRTMVISPPSASIVPIGNLL